MSDAKSQCQVEVYDYRTGYRRCRFAVQGTIIHPRDGRPIALCRMHMRLKRVTSGCIPRYSEKAEAERVVRGDA